jgi:hypothetical protein
MANNQPNNRRRVNPWFSANDLDFWSDNSNNNISYLSAHKGVLGILPIFGVCTLLVYITCLLLAMGTSHFYVVLASIWKLASSSYVKAIIILCVINYFNKLLMKMSVFEYVKNQVISLVKWTVLGLTSLTLALYIPLFWVYPVIIPTVLLLGAMLLYFSYQTYVHYFGGYAVGFIPFSYHFVQVYVDIFDLVDTTVRFMFSDVFIFYTFSVGAFLLLIYLSKKYLCYYTAYVTKIGYQTFKSRNLERKEKYESKTQTLLVFEAYGTYKCGLSNFPKLSRFICEPNFAMQLALQLQQYSEERLVTACTSEYSRHVLFEKLRFPFSRNHPLASLTEMQIDDVIEGTCVFAYHMAQATRQSEGLNSFF